MHPLRSRRRLAFTLVGAAFSLAAVTFVFAQNAMSSDNASCMWTGWFSQRIGHSADVIPELQPGETKTVRMSRGCVGIGIGDSTDPNAWIVIRGETSRLDGDGFTVERREGWSFVLTVYPTAVSGRRSLRSMEIVGDSAVTAEMPFTVGSVDAENTEGFCCRNEGSPCDVLMNTGGPHAGPDRCGKGNTWVPVTASYGYDEKKDFCDYRICGVPGECCVPNGGGADVGSLQQLTQNDCRSYGGVFLQNAPDAAAQAAANCARPPRYYCDPSAAVSWIDVNTGEEKTGVGECRGVSPSENGTYRPTGLRGFAYRAPGAPEYDTWTESMRDCRATCGYYYCVYIPVSAGQGGAFQITRGCANRPTLLRVVQDTLCEDEDEWFNPFYEDRADGTYIHPPFCSTVEPEDLRGLNPAQAAMRLYYTLHDLRAGAHQYRRQPGYDIDEDEPEDAFDTFEHCALACPPCTGGACLGVRR